MRDSLPLSSSDGLLSGSKTLARSGSKRSLAKSSSQSSINKADSATATGASNVKAAVTSGISTPTLLRRSSSRSSASPIIPIGKSPSHDSLRRSPSKRAGSARSIPGSGCADPTPDGHQTTSSAVTAAYRPVLSGGLSSSSLGKIRTAMQQTVNGQSSQLNLIQSQSAQLESVAMSVAAASTTADALPVTPVIVDRSIPFSPSAPSSPERSIPMEGVQRRLSRRGSSASSLHSLGAPTDFVDMVPLNAAAGRVKVFVRVRPLTDAEASSPDEHHPVQVGDDRKTVTLSDAKREQTFGFDHVFPMDATNKELFHAVGKPAVLHAMNGFNGTVMAYGQTGTGKTHTLTSNDGLTPRVVNFLFKRIAKDAKNQYKVVCSYVQIFNDKIYDLIGDEKRQSSSATTTQLSGKLYSSMDSELVLRENTERGVYIEDVAEYVVQSPKEVFDLIKLGRSRLVFAETKMNRASSRSHAVCFLSLERTTRKGELASFSAGDTNVDSQVDASSSEPDTKFLSEDDDDDDDDDDDQSLDEEMSKGNSDSPLNIAGKDFLLRGRLIICDLAGSERIKKTHAVGERLNEAQQINLSLLELGNVIHALTDSKRMHVPFRNSTLTRLLQESLGGNCKTSLVVCVSPGRRDLSETKGTLSFGFRAMHVKTCARINVEIDYKALSDALAEQIRGREEEWAQREAALLHQIANARTTFEEENRGSSKLLQEENEQLEEVIAGLVKELDEKRQQTEELSRTKAELMKIKEASAFYTDGSLAGNTAAVLAVQSACVFVMERTRQQQDPSTTDNIANHLNSILRAFDHVAPNTSHAVKKHVDRLSLVLNGIVSASSIASSEEYKERIAAVEKAAELTCESLENDVQDALKSTLERTASSGNEVLAIAIRECLQHITDRPSRTESVSADLLLRRCVSNDDYMIWLGPYLGLYSTSHALRLTVAALKARMDAVTRANDWTILAANDIVKDVVSPAHEDECDKLGEPNAHNSPENETRPLAPGDEKFRLEVQAFKLALDEAHEQQSRRNDEIVALKERAINAEQEKADVELELAQLKTRILPAPPPKTVDAATTMPGAVPEHGRPPTSATIRVVGDVDDNTMPRQTPACVVGGKECVIM